MEEIVKLHGVIEDLLRELRDAVEDRRSLTNPQEAPHALQLVDEVEDVIRQLQAAARRRLNLENDVAKPVPPFKEALQIIVGSAAETLGEVEEFRQHIVRFLSQSQLQKGLTWLLDWTSDLDYALDRMRTITRRLQKIAVQLERVESLAG